MAPQLTAPARPWFALGLGEAFWGAPAPLRGQWLHRRGTAVRPCQRSANASYSLASNTLVEHPGAPHGVDTEADLRAVQGPGFRL